MRRRLLWVALVVLTAAACSGPPPEPFTLASPDIGANGEVPTWAIGQYQSYCQGQNRSPRLTWHGVPAGTESFALLMGDAFSHWVVTDIPADVTSLQSAPDGQVAHGTIGTSLAGTGAYIGPCVPGHEYVYTLYALDTTLDGSPATLREEVAALIDGHVLAEASLTARP